MPRRKRDGGTPKRSEVVTVRLDPKLKYLAELAARKHRRPLSSFIEWAVEQSLSGLVENAEVHRPGVEIDAAVMLVLFCVESHRVSSFLFDGSWLDHRAYPFSGGLRRGPG